MASLSAADMGIGPHAMYGFSPAQDLLAAYLNANRPEQEHGNTQEPLNILLANPADVRHVLKTIACRRRHSSRDDGGALRPIHFYIWDRPIEVLARHLALLQLAQDYEIPIRQRTSLWLEVFGNTLVQERTAGYIERLGKELGHSVCDQSGPLAKMVDLSLLKFRERDALETNFKTWGSRVPFDVTLLRDTRLRRLYDQRYDVRENVIDWDYHEGVKPVASIIHYKQFRDWRLTGVAYEFGDQTYTQPNRTMASYAEGTMCKGKDKGAKKEVRGYWLDLVVGPFVALGVDCDKPNKFAEDLFLIHNKGTGVEQHRHHAVEVAVYNLLSFLYEIETGSIYQMTREHDIYSGLGNEEEGSVGGEGEDTAPRPKATEEEQAKEKEEEQQLQELSPEDFERLMKLKHKKEIVENGASTAAASSDPTTNSRAAASGGKDESTPQQQKTPEQLQMIAKSYEGIKIHLMGDDFRAMYNKKRFENLFELVVFSVGSSHYMADAELKNILSSKGAYIEVENAKYVVPLNKKAKIEYVNKIRDMAAGQGWSDDFGRNKRNIEDLRLRDVLPFHHATAEGSKREE